MFGNGRERISDLMLQIKMYKIGPHAGNLVYSNFHRFFSCLIFNLLRAIDLQEILSICKLSSLEVIGQLGLDLTLFSMVWGGKGGAPVRTLLPYIILKFQGPTGP